MNKAIQRKAVFLLLIASSLFILPACRTTRKIVNVPIPVKLKGQDVIQLFDSVTAHQLEFTWLVGKAEVEYSDHEGSSETFDVNIRMKKDSAIWLSVTPLLGIEAVRVMITPDSMRILDRIHKTYMSRNFGFLDDMLKTKVNFEIMQAVIVGNYFPYLKNEKLKSVYEDSTFIILSTLSKHKAKRVLEDKDPNKPIIQDFWIDGNYKINRSRITDEKLNRTMEADYNNFFELNPVTDSTNSSPKQHQNLFPQNIEVSITASTQIKIKVRYSKISPEVTTLPFSVPEKYERK